MRNDLPGLSVMLLVLAAWPSSAVEVDLSALPPPAAKQIDFLADIRPILSNSCFRCHGPERPRSRFRLDNREAALKGGLNGVDIVAGDSANSPLIHYVARLVEGMEMPPFDKGDPLTREQIGLLRAWIDQGVPWDESEPRATVSFSAAPALRFITVNGDEQKFREHHWQREGWNGGVEDFEFQQRLDDRTRLRVSGHALLDDYQVALKLERSDVGFVRGGWHQFRRYYDDTGGYYPLFSMPGFDLDRDLHLDIGRAWVDFGLTLPDWPRLVVGYEFQYRDGEKATLQWGPVSEGFEADGVTPRMRGIYPSSKTIDEQVHVIKFDLDYEAEGYRIEDTFRAEFFDLNTGRMIWGNYTPGDPAPSSRNDVREGAQYFQGANAFRVEKPFTEYLLASGGYLYSKLNADAGFAGDVLISGSPTPLMSFRSQEITLERENHVGNLNVQAGPWNGLTVSGGLQAEWINQSGLGGSSIVAPFLPDPLLLAARSDLDTRSLEERAGLRYTGIPFAVLFAEGRWRQESRGIFEEQSGGEPLSQDFRRDTSASGELRDYRAGFSTSPWQSIVLSAHYRRYEKDNNYRDVQDEPESPLELAYPAFIRSRETRTDEIEARLVWRPLSWLKTSVTYKRVESDFHTRGDPVTNFLAGLITTGESVFAGNHDADVYSVNLTLTPWQRLHLNSTFMLHDSRTVAFDNGASAVVPYRGEIYTVLASGSFVVNAETELFASYAFSRADFSQSNLADGLPVGIEYEQHGLQVGVRRKWSENLSSQVQYGWFHYHEPSSGNFNDYTAHAVFASFSLRLP